jgi:prepilin-type N-terminal cleavage/methylation domain-containing protein
MKCTRGFTLLEITIAAAVLTIIVGAVIITSSGNNNDERALRNAALSLQADMRYAQRRAVTEGRRVGVAFEVSRNRYHIITLDPLEIHRTVYFQNGVTLLHTNFDFNRVMFLPRGTAVPGTIVLTNGIYWQEITTTLSGGQVRIHTIKEVDN